MPTVPTELPEQARRGLAQIGLDDAALAVLGAGDNFVESEKAFRQVGRLQAVGAEAARSRAPQNREERYNAAGRRQMQQAAEAFDRARNIVDQDTRQQIDRAVGTAEFRDMLSEARAEFHDNIVSADIAGGEAEEVISLWNEAQTTLESEGFDGLLNRGRDRARQVHEARGRPNKGREPHSPLAAWKYYIIAGAILVGVGAIIACFIFGGCSWVVALVGFLGGAASGWIIEMIKNGCAPIPVRA
jgi:hypothetical protein